MTSAIRSLGRMEWQASLLLAVVFGAGVVVGMAVDRTRVPAVAGPMARNGGPLPPYLEDLGLSPDQHAKIKAILDAQKPKVDTVWDGVLPKLHAISDFTFEAIRHILTPEQRQLFDAERPRRDLAPGMPGGPGGRGGRGRAGFEGRGPPPEGRGPPPRERH
jgi:hypothetical protein